MSDAGLLLLLANSTSETCSVDTMPVVMQVNGWLLFVGILGSYVPQMISFARFGTFGVSYGYVLLTAISGMLLAIATIFGKLTTVACCRLGVWTANQCADKLLPVFQFSAAFLGQFILALLYAIRQTENKLPMRLGLLGLLFGAAVLSISGGAIYMYGGYERLEIFAIVCAVGNVVSGTVLFAPQIMMTYRLKTSGNLSIITLVIQTGGLIDFIIFTIIEDPHEPYVYGAQIVQFSFCAILLGMCLWYDHIKAWWLGRRGDFGLVEAFGDMDDGNVMEHEMQARTLLDEDFLDEDF